MFDRLSTDRNQTWLEYPHFPFFLVYIVIYILIHCINATGVGATCYNSDGEEK